MTKTLRTFLSASALSLFSPVLSAQICDPSGNYMIFSNYDGGRLTINVDVNIPNLKIGIVSYEAVEITLTGTYLSNVVAVDYSGYNGSNNHCPPLISTTTITGFASPTINITPPATMADPDGYPYIICAYNCAGTTGGCNTSEQVEHYYQTMFGGTMYAHYTQYGCWSSTPYAMSAGGTCCSLVVPPTPPVANFNMPSGPYCVGDCLSFTDMSVNSPTSWNWTISGGSPGSSTLQNPSACFMTPGNFNITLVASNTAGTDVMTQSINVAGVNNSTSVSGATITAQATGAGYQWINCGTGAAIPGATTQSYTATSNGLYAVVVTEGGCSDTSACTNITSVGLYETFTGEEIGLYPNPSKGYVTIEDKFGVLKKAQVNIINALGKQVYTTTLNENKRSIDLSAQPRGVYFVSVKTAEHTLVKKLVLE